MTDYGNGNIRTRSFGAWVDPNKGYAVWWYVGSDTVTYDKPGRYTLTAAAVDEFGTSASQSMTLNILPPLPPTLKRITAFSTPDINQPIYNPNAITAVLDKYGSVRVDIWADEVNDFTTDGFGHQIPGYGMISSSIDCGTGLLPERWRSHCSFNKPGEYAITIKLTQEGIDGATVYTIPVYVQ